MTSCLYLPPGPWDSSVMPAAGNQQESPLHSRLTGIKPMTKRSVGTSLTTRQHYPQDTISGRYNIRSIQYQVIIMMETQSTCLFSVYTCQSCDVKAPRPTPSVLFKFELASLSCKLPLQVSDHCYSTDLYLLFTLFVWINIKIISGYYYDGNTVYLLFSVYTCQSCDVKAPRPTPSVLFKFELASLS